MNTRSLLLTAMIVVLISNHTLGQVRYIDDVFEKGDIITNKEIIYAENFEFLYSDLSDSAVVAKESALVKASGDSIPPEYYDPYDTSTHLKVTRLAMDVYRPNETVDTLASRPVIIYLHGGAFLPKYLNGTCIGSKTDSFAVALCTKMAQKGYVAVSIDYRMGWNPFAPSEKQRRLTYVMAMYRAIHDTKMGVRYLREDGRSVNRFGIDPDRIFLIGDATGAEVAAHYAVLDKFEELNRLRAPIGLSVDEDVIDTLVLGNIDGSGGLLNLYDDTSEASVQAVVVAKGGLLDTSWIGPGDPPFIAFHTLFSGQPEFETLGIQILPTYILFRWSGPNIFMPIMNVSGNNDPLRSKILMDPYSQGARKHYGRTFNDCRYSPDRDVMVTSNGENLYPFYIPCDTNGYYFNEGAPWQWWDTSDASCKSTIMDQKMSATKGGLYLDTIVHYMCPRLANLFYPMPPGTVEETQMFDVNAFPNPTTGPVNMTFSRLSTSVEITVIDPIGRKVRSITMEPGLELRLALGEATGVYTVLIHNENGEMTVVRVVRM